jgi:hypothetical protein
MTIKSVFAAILLGLSFSVTAQVNVVSMAYEVALEDFRAPATLNGATSFKECGSCDEKLVRVTADTRYAINGESVRLEDFRKVLMQVNDRDDTYVIVLHHLESDTVASLSVSL